MTRSIDSPYALYAGMRMICAAGARNCAARSMIQLADQTDDPFFVAAAAGLATDEAMYGDAERLISRLESLDPCRAGIEGLWLEYRSGRRGATPVEDIVDKAFGRLCHDGGRPVPATTECGRLALVLGKLLSDQGRFEPARTWLLGAIALFRRQGDWQSLAAANGALAEVMYLGGDPLAALELLMVDEALLEPGSCERDRLMVYRAHCLRELGEFEAARNLYSEARAAARLRGAPDSPWAARGLLWCMIRESEGRASRGDVNEMSALLEVCATEPHCHATGLLALSWFHQSDHEPSVANACRQQAAELFGANGFHVEAALAKGENPCVQPVPWERSACPIRGDACDEPFASLPLTPRDESLQRAHQALADGRGAGDLTAAIF